MPPRPPIPVPFPVPLALVLPHPPHCPPPSASKVRMSLLEIRDETIRDLLTPDGPSLTVSSDPAQGVTVPGLAEVDVATGEAAAKLLEAGLAARAGSAAGGPPCHTVLSLTVQMQDGFGIVGHKSITRTRVGRAQLVDLGGGGAGSGGAGGQRGGSISVSLACLGLVIGALSEEARHVPYRYGADMGAD